MRKATKADKAKVIDIISESFDTNPSVNWAIKQDRKRLRRLKVLAEYTFNTVYRRGGIYLSSDEEGVILFYKENAYSEGLADYIDQAKMALFAVGLSRVPQILKSEAYKKKIRPNDGEFIYCWFYGVKEQARGRGAAKELKRFIEQVADEQQLPIYLETSVYKNTVAYKRYGYTTYHEWNMKGANKTLWFMRRESRPCHI